MAVYQISRIQIRRGQANSGTGLPQLASGEMAWAIDTQELYIGSGAVSEGAPGVSNIKVITQQDLSVAGNILGTIQYVYKSGNASIITGASATAPVLQSLSSKMDQFVTTADFGTAADDATDDTAALQRAINQLFLNPSNKASVYSCNRVVLNIPAGTYKTTSTIYIPSYATIIGAGLDKTIIDYYPTQISVVGNLTNGTTTLTTSSASTAMIGYIITGTGIPNGTLVSGAVNGTSLTISNLATATNTGGTFVVTAPGPAFQFVNDSSSIGNYDPSIAQSTTQCRFVTIKEMTIQTATGNNIMMQLNSVKDSIFEHIKLVGGWTGNTTSIGINMTGVSSLVTCTHNIFRNIVASGFNYCVYDSAYDISNNNFINCHFTNSFQGISLGASWTASVANPNGPIQTQILNTRFYNIKQQAVYVGAGFGNITRECIYQNVGNNGSGNGSPQYPQVYFASYGNTSLDDQSDRFGDLGNPTTGSYALIPYVPEVSGHGQYSSFGNNSITLTQTTSSYVQIIKLPLPWISTPQYLYNATGVTLTGPTGNISYSINYIYDSATAGYTRRGVLNIVADVANKAVAITDEYDFTTTGSAYSTTLDFQVQFLDNTGAVTTSNPWSILITYQNTTPSDTGKLIFSYSSTF